jgi:WD40 repeat protein
MMPLGAGEQNRHHIWRVTQPLSTHHHFISERLEFLASASDDKTARLWDLDTSLPVGPALHHDEGVDCAALSADGTVLGC